MIRYACVFDESLCDQFIFDGLIMRAHLGIDGRSHEVFSIITDVLVFGVMDLHIYEHRTDDKADGSSELKHDQAPAGKIGPTATYRQPFQYTDRLERRQVKCRITTSDYTGG